MNKKLLFMIIALVLVINRCTDTATELHNINVTTTLSANIETQNYAGGLFGEVDSSTVRGSNISVDAVMIDVYEMVGLISGKVYNSYIDMTIDYLNVYIGLVENSLVVDVGRLVGYITESHINVYMNGSIRDTVEQIVGDVPILLLISDYEARYGVGDYSDIYPNTT